MMTTLGVIGGSGLYEMEALEGVEERTIDTPFGDASSPIVSGFLGDTRVCFLARHGRGHVFAPSQVSYRANVYALKALGATHLLSISAVGSLREELAPGHVAVPSQLLDRTTRRVSTFFDERIVAHVAVADPYCPLLSDAVADAAQATGTVVHRDKTYVCIEGPRFSTRAESHAHRAMGADVVGMTAAPEAFLAREAELPYATLALVTDYDCWRPREDVDVPAILAILRANVTRARAIIAHVSRSLPDPRMSPAYGALRHAIVTTEIDPALRAKYSVLIGP
ncbi:S-methyl-5'-thioadenosine phosphorylase [soil metagenome]